MNTETLEFKCQVPKCGRAFKSAPALRMHTIRAHVRGWDTSANFHKKNKTREEVLARKRAYNKRVRAENIAKGLTGLGKPRKRPFQGKRPVFGSKWTPERRKKFKDTWEAKKNGLNPPVIKQEHLEDPRSYINHCPNCGKRLVAYYLAEGAEKRYGR